VGKHSKRQGNKDDLLKRGQDENVCLLWIQKQEKTIRERGVH